MQSIVKPETSTEPVIDEFDDNESPVDSTSPRPLWRSAAEIGVMLVILFGLLNLLTADTQVNGSSMSPALDDSERVLASRITYALFPPERGDVILVVDPLSPSRVLVRRVIGLPGERVELRGRQVLINGQPLTEDYIGNPLTISDNVTTTSQLQVPANQYFVLGDNRVSINDSRSWGPIPDDSILGRAWLVYWPPETIGIVKHARYQDQPSGGSRGN